MVEFDLVHTFLQMKLFADEVTAVFNKKFSSFALYDGRDGSVPYQTSEKFREKDLDKRFVTDLRRWFRDFQIDEGIVERNETTFIY